MPTSVSFNATNYSIPASGEVAWASLSNFLIAVAQNAQTTNKQVATIRTATSTPVTVVSATDYCVIVNLAVAGASAVTLPTGVNGQIFVIIDGKGDGATNNITVSGSSQNIAGAATFVINKNYGAAVFQFSTTESQWLVSSSIRLVANADVASNAAIAYSKLDLADRIVNADVNAAAGIVYSKLSVSDGDIPRAKLAVGSNNHVLINSAAGASSSEAQLAITRGGTGQATKAAAFDALSPVTSKGELVVRNATTSVALTPGGDGTVLTADAAEANGLKWTAPLTNPMTTEGDIILGGASGAATRLGIGTENQILQKSGGTLAWQDGFATNLVPGLVNTGAQTIAGNKTLTGTVAIGTATVGNHVITGSTVTMTVTAINVDGAQNVGTGAALDLRKGINSTATTNRFINFGINSTYGNSGCIAANGVNTAAFQTTSDARLKTNVVSYEGGLEKIAALRPVTFEWLSHPGEPVLGFIAQEVESVVSDAVAPPATESDFYTMCRENFIPHLVSAVKELKAENDALKARLSILESKA